MTETSLPSDLTSRWEGFYPVWAPDCEENGTRRSAMQFSTGNHHMEVFLLTETQYMD